MKKLIAVILALMVAGAVYANGSKDQGTKSGAAAGEKKTVTIWCYWETVKHQETLAKVCKDYNATQKTVEVVVKYVPFADFKKQLSIGAVASELPDIVIIDNPDHASYSAMGIFADVTDKFSASDLAQYYEGPLNSCKLNGRLYGIPFGSNCLSLFYNVDMLKAAGCNPPKTWDELKDVAIKTTKGNVHGFGISSLQNEEGTFGFMCWLWGTGNSSFKINDANGIKALSLVRDLAKSGAMPKEVINWTQGDTMNQFISGNLAMMVNGPWQVPTMRAQAPNLKWAVVQLPVGNVAASDLGGENFGVVKGPNVDASVAFLKYATSADKIKSYINDFGYIASRKDVADTQFTNDPIMTVFAKQMANAHPRGPHARWPEISDAISLAMNECVTGISTPEASAAKAQKTIDAIVK